MRATAGPREMRHADEPGPSRREALWRIGTLASAVLLASCGGGSGETSAPPPTPPVPTPPPSPLDRVKVALSRDPLTQDTSPISVTQGSANSAASSLGAGFTAYPPLSDNSQPLTLATIAEVWGHRRDRWRWPTTAMLGGHKVYPITSGVSGLHFRFDGAAFEILFAGTGAKITLVVNGRYMAPTMIRTTYDAGVAGVPLSTDNTFTRFDFGTRAPREISAYVWSSYGPCAVAVAAGDSLQPWDRSSEASFVVMADSYAAGATSRWLSGPFWEAATMLGIPHLYVDGIGSTGYAPNAVERDLSHAFHARLARNVDAQPDLFLTAGGINDNNSHAVPGLYATPEAAMAGFNAAVNLYYSELRAALPDAVLVATGPWAPQQETPTNTYAQAKADTIRNALRDAGGPWVFLDNLNGGWANSTGASSLQGGPWQTGTGTVSNPRGDGNGDQYISADGTHPNEAGCLYLATRLATDLRVALQAL